MFGPLNFFIRWLFTTFSVFAAYNPSGVSYWHWVLAGNAPVSLVAATGVALLAIFVFIVRSAWRSIKPLGMALGAAFFALLCVTLVDLGLVRVSAPWVVTVLAMLSLASVLTVGLSFSAIRTRLAGQVDSDDVGR